MKKLLLAAALLLASFAASATVTVTRANSPDTFIFVGTTLPATCQIGDLAFDSDAAAGSNIYGCTAANTWTVQSGGGGLTIGTTAITGGTAGRVLFEATGPVISDDAGMTYNATTDTLTVGNLATAGLVDGRDVSVDGAKLDGLPASAIQDVGLDGSTSATPRGRINLVTGAGTVVAVADNAGTNSKDVTLTPQQPQNSQSGTTYTIGAADRGKLIKFTSATAVTATFDASATLAAGWWAITQNAMTGTSGVNKTLTFAATGGETLDGATNSYDYPGAVRRWVNIVGTGLVSQILTGGFIEILTADSPFTLNIPTAITEAEVELWGSGGGGGGGGTAVGGSGGGGGAHVSSRFRASDLSTSQTVTVGAGPAAATNGNTTTFGSLLTGWAGGRGTAGGANIPGGGGASMFASGNIGTGGVPLVTAAGGASGWGGASGVNAAAGVCNAMGGATGGGANTASVFAGGASYRGGRGGGSGGAVSTQTTGAAGGGTQAGAAACSGGGGAGGAPSGSGAAASNGTPVSATSTPEGPGLGGGGGGANTSTGNGGVGATGGIASGGGGGGAAGTGTPGAGGPGGPGMARFRYR